MSNIDDKIAILAAKIADEASAEDVTLDVRIDAFKALTPYLKINARGGADAEDEEHSFATFQRTIAAAPGRA